MKNKSRVILLFRKLMKASTCQHFGSYLDDLLDRDDIPSMPQAYRLFWGQAFVALLHHLQMTTIISS